MRGKSKDLPVLISYLSTFEDVVVMDIVLYGAGLSLEFVTLFVLRIRQPRVHRPFKIPLGNTGLLLMLLLPVSVYIIALSGALHSSGGMVMPALISIGMLISAELTWRLVVWRTPALKQVT